MQERRDRTGAENDRMKYYKALRLLQTQGSPREHPRWREEWSSQNLTSTYPPPPPPARAHPHVRFLTFWDKQRRGADAVPHQRRADRVGHHFYHPGDAGQNPQDQHRDRDRAGLRHGNLFHVPPRRSGRHLPGKYGMHSGVGQESGKKKEKKAGWKQSKKGHPSKLYVRTFGTAARSPGSWVCGDRACRPCVHHGRFCGFARRRRTSPACTPSLFVCQQGSTKSTFVPPSGVNLCV